MIVVSTRKILYPGTKNTSFLFVNMQKMLKKRNKLSAFEFISIFNVQNRQNTVTYPFQFISSQLSCGSSVLGWLFWSCLLLFRLWTWTGSLHVWFENTTSLPKSPTSRRLARCWSARDTSQSTRAGDAVILAR